VRTVFSSVFETDFAEIIAYFAGDVSPALSLRFEDSVVETYEQIATHPKIGRRRTDLAHPEIRSLVVTGFENYIVFYQIREADVFFIRLLHGARDLPGLL
jgi:toxin ParE1/3/4